MKILRKASNKGRLKYGAFKAVKHLSKLVKNLKKLALILENGGQVENKSTSQIFDKITTQIFKINKKADFNVL